MKTLTAITTIGLITGLSITSTAYGRYDGLVDVFNSAVRHIDPPPPRDLTLEYKPKDFDPPGLNTPDIGGSAPAQTFTPPKPTLTQEFNGVK